MKTGRSKYFYFFSAIFCIAIFLRGCVTPYEPKIDKYDNLLVVEGILTNFAGSCKVKLTHTYPYNRKNPLPETGAVVTVMDDIGNEIVLKGNKDGEYVPEDSTFSGMVGLRYKITIETTGGEQFESEFEELKEPVPIESIRYEAQDKGQGVTGVQLYLDTYDPLNNSFYYGWDFSETWQIEVPYVSNSVYLPEMKICYRNNSTSSIIIKSTKDYVEDKLVKFPFYFIDNSSNRLYLKYSILLKQYVLNEKSYIFYKNLKDINENVGTLFDKTPVILIGNIRNKIQPEKPVLGNFQVSGVSEKRIFIYNSDLPSNIRETFLSGYDYCTTDVVSIRNDRIRLDSLLGVGWAVMDTIFEEAELDTFLGLAFSRACFDCKLTGDINMPPYWLDE